MRLTRTAASAVVVLAVLTVAAAAQEGERKRESRELKGTVLSVDAEGGRISIRRGGDGAWDYSLKIGGDVSVLIDGREGKLSEIPAGAVVTCRLSPDETEVLAVRAEGRTAKLAVWAVDVAGRTITLAGGDEGERTWPLADGVPVGDLRGGERVSVRFSVDGKRVVGVAAGPGGKGGSEGGQGGRAKGDGEGKRGGPRDGDREGGVREEGKRKPEGGREGEGRKDVKRKPEGDRGGERQPETKRKPEGDREGEGRKDVKRKPEGDREGERQPEADRKPGRDREGDRKGPGGREREGEGRGKEEGKGGREEGKDER